MSKQPWETHDRLCSSRRPSVAYPRKACPECRAIDAARAETLDRVREKITTRMSTEPDIPRRTGMGYAVEEIDALRGNRYSDSHQPQVDGTEAHDE